MIARKAREEQKLQPEGCKALHAQMASVRGCTCWHWSGSTAGTGERLLQAVGAGLGAAPSTCLCGRAGTAGAPPAAAAPPFAAVSPATGQTNDSYLALWIRIRRP